jgi:hypothetical protein
MASKKFDNVDLKPTVPIKAHLILITIFPKTVLPQNRVCNFYANKEAFVLPEVY